MLIKSHERQHPAIHSQLYDVLAGWTKDRITAGLQSGALVWTAERGLTGRAVHLLTTTDAGSCRVIATAFCAQKPLTDGNE